MKIQLLKNSTVEVQIFEESKHPANKYA